MNLTHAAVMGVLQGLAEFLPISSSGHLILFPWLLNWPDPGLTFDVALHAGTLIAVIGYFYRDWLGLLSAARKDPRSPQARMLLFIALATIPGGVIGFLLEQYAETAFRAPPVIAAALIIFALLLDLADRRGAKDKGMEDLGLWQAVRIGLGQALAVVPGVSRSGITMTVGLLEGLNAPAAARFSFLLSTPIILGAALYKLRHLGAGSLDAAFGIGIICSAVTGLAAIRFLLGYLQRSTCRIFTAYRVGLGLTVLAVHFWRG